jgi:hypothetical protein
MGLSRRQLGPDEQIVVEVRLGPGGLVAPALVLILVAGLSLGCFIVAGRPAEAHASWLRIGAAVLGGVGVVVLVWLLARYLSWRAETVTVTSDRLVLSRGVLRRRTDQVLLGRVVDVHVDRRLAQRIVGRGDLVLELSDGQSILVEGLGKPDAFQRVVLRQAGLDVGVPDASTTTTAEAMRMARPLVVTEFDPTPPKGTPSVSAVSSTADLIRLDEIDRLEAEGVLDQAEAERRRWEISQGR